MKKAIEEAKEEGVRTVSARYGIPYGTLYRHVQSGKVKKKLGRFQPIFSSKQEQELAAYLKDLDSVFLGLTRTEFLQLVFQYAEKNGIKHPFCNGSAGPDWFAGFRKRHPEIVLRIPEPTSVARVRGFNRPQVERFYSLLWEQIQKHSIDAGQLYNMDETGIRTTTSKPPKILSIRGKKQMGIMSSSERGTLTTVICCCNATGSFIPPFMIFARKRMQDVLMDGAPPGSKGICTDNGWINGEAFLTWLSWFVDVVRPTATKKVLLLLDNHEAHKYYPALHFASKNHVMMLSFAPHTTHRMQPLDVAVYRALKIFFEQEISAFQKQHIGRIIKPHDIAKLLAPAYLKAASAQNAVSGFKTPGIWPYNPSVFGDEDFVPASIMSHNGNATLPAGLQETTMHEADKTRQMSSPEADTIQLASSPEAERRGQVSTREARRGQVSSPEADHTIGRASLPEAERRGLVSECEADGMNHTSVHVPDVDCEGPSCSYRPVDIRPIPKLDVVSGCTRKRKLQASELLTGSPVKRLQMEKLEKKKKMNLNVTKSTYVRVKKKKNQTQATRIKKQYFCIVCDELYVDPPTEDWIQCSKCSNWSHESCTTYNNVGLYYCNRCL